MQVATMLCLLPSCAAGSRWHGHSSTQRKAMTTAFGNIGNLARFFRQQPINIHKSRMSWSCPAEDPVKASGSCQVMLSRRFSRCALAWCPSSLASPPNLAAIASARPRTRATHTCSACYGYRTPSSQLPSGVQLALVSWLSIGSNS
jgi:hypothetical protein